MDKPGGRSRAGCLAGEGGVAGKPNLEPGGEGGGGNKLTREDPHDGRLLARAEGTVAQRLQSLKNLRRGVCGGTEPQSEGNQRGRAPHPGSECRREPYLAPSPLAPGCRGAPRARGGWAARTPASAPPGESWRPKSPRLLPGRCLRALPGMKAAVRMGRQLFLPGKGTERWRRGWRCRRRRGRVANITKQTLSGKINELPTGCGRGERGSRDSPSAGARGLTGEPSARGVGPASHFGQRG